MGTDTLQDLLPLVEKPSRYLGSEINRIVKDPKDIRLHMALAYPDLYEIGTSHFGIQILYHILNEQPDILAERVFAPAVDMGAQLRKTATPLMSLETRRSLRLFDIIGFSLLYELNYTNVLLMLELSGVPFFSRERDLSFPIIIGGGPCTVNPEPVADFFDAMVIGDGESVIVEMARAWIRWKEGGGQDKTQLLEKWSKLEGVYIPSFFRVDYGVSGFQTVQPEYDHHTRVKRTVVADLNTAPFPETPVVPYGNPVHDRLRLEVSRGCTRGCRFCQAGMIYRPVRERSPETLIALYEQSVAATGYEDLSLLSLSTGDYTCITPLMTHLMERCGNERVAVSLPSLRADTLTPEMMRLIKKVRKTGFTIAPEAGSQRLRDVINKNISEKDIVATVKDAFDLGWKVVKLYFMIGLPTEKQQDLQDIVDLVSTLRKTIREKNRNGKLNVSVATFVPKPHTPFQWASQLDLEASSKKIKWIRAELKKPGIHVKWQDPRVSRIEGLWARGDRRLGGLLVSAFKKGCMFDGWSDHFREDLWMSAIEETHVDIDFFTSRHRAMSEPLPWDHVDTGVTGDYLKQEWQKAVNEDLTGDCRTGDCNDCGVCDFKAIAPIVYENCAVQAPVCSETGSGREPVYHKLQVFFTKKGPARFFGHLEMVNVFTRAIRRAGLPIKFSEGFHPKPKISFEDTLPIGMESEQETMWLTVAEGVSTDHVHRKLDRQLPPGLRIVECRHAGVKSKRQSSVERTYKITVKGGVFDEKRLKCFSESDEWIIERKNKKGRIRTIDLKKAVTGMETIGSDNLRMTILSGTGMTVRPEAVMIHVLKMSREQCKKAKIIKEKERSR